MIFKAQRVVERRVYDGKGTTPTRTEVVFTIEIDADALATYFAPRLARSTGKVSRVQGGAIKATRLSKRVL